MIAHWSWNLTKIIFSCDGVQEIKSKLQLLRSIYILVIHNFLIPTNLKL